MVFANGEKKVLPLCSLFFLLSIAYGFQEVNKQLPMNDVLFFAYQIDYMETSFFLQTCPLSDGC
jgi:hypothetical protein